jgi:hypothetical protein
MKSGQKSWMGISFTLFILLALFSTTVLSASNREWAEPENLSEWQEDVFTNFSLKLAENGSMTAYWVRINSSLEWSLWARVRPPAGEWGPAENLSGWINPINVGPGSFTLRWLADIMPDGTSWAAWVEDTSTPTVDSMWLRAAYKEPDKAWLRDDPSIGVDTYIQSLDLEVGPQGHLIIVWTDCTQDPSTGGGCLVRARRRSSVASGWGLLERLDNPGTAEPIQYAQALSGPDGRFVVLWDERDFSTFVSSYWAIAYNVPPGAWDLTPTNISGPRESFYQTQAVIDPAGTVTAGFIALSSPGNQRNYASTRIAVTGTWSGAVPISQESKFIGGPRLGVGQDGTVSAAWAEGNPSMTEWTVFANSRDAGEIWETTATQIAPWRKTIYDPYVGIWPDGSTMVVWAEEHGSRPVSEDEAVFYSVRPPHGNWGAGGEGQIGGWFDTVFFNMDLDMGLDGSAGVIWSATDSNRPVNQQQAVFSAFWPPGGQWNPPDQLSDWQQSVWVERQDSLVLDKMGNFVGALWYENRLAAPEFAIFFRDSGLIEQRVTLPIVLKSE